MTEKERIEHFVAEFNELVQKYGVTVDGYIMSKSKTDPPSEETVKFVALEPALVKDWKETE